MAYLVVKNGEQQGSRIELDRAVVRIGRREDNDGVVQDASVSGSHCEIEKSAEGFSIRDLGSTNGTLLNNEPVGSNLLPLYRNDIIKIGDIVLSIEGDDLPSNDSGMTPEPLTRATLVIQPNKNVVVPDSFAARSNSNKIWIAVIAVLLIVVAFLAWQFLTA